MLALKDAELVVPEQVAGGDQEEDLLVMADTDGDGEIQHGEATHFVEGLGSHGHAESLALFQAQDADSSEGLNGREFAEALEAWGGGCTSRHVSSYCVGASRSCCCQHGGMWSSCGCHGHVTTCGGGYHGASSGGYHTPYSSGGSYHTSGPYHSSGGAYHSGPYGSSGYHYHTR